MGERIEREWREIDRSDISQCTGEHNMHAWVTPCDGGGWNWMVSYGSSFIEFIGKAPNASSNILSLGYQELAPDACDEAEMFLRTAELVAEAVQRDFSVVPAASMTARFHMELRVRVLSPAEYDGPESDARLHAVRDGGAGETLGYFPDAQLAERYRQDAIRRLLSE